jgi:hypothetical protein
VTQIGATLHAHAPVRPSHLRTGSLTRASIATQATAARPCSPRMPPLPASRPRSAVHSARRPRAATRSRCSRAPRVATAGCARASTWHSAWAPTQVMIPTWWARRRQLGHANPSFDLRRWRMVAAPTLLVGQTHLATRAVFTSPAGGVEVAQS